MGNPYLTASDVMELLKVSRTSAYRIIRNCEHIRVPGGIRVSEVELHRYLRNSKCPGYSDEAISTGQIFAMSGGRESRSVRKITKSQKPVFDKYNLLKPTKKRKAQQ